MLQDKKNNHRIIIQMYKVIDISFVYTFPGTHGEKVSEHFDQYGSHDGQKKSFTFLEHEVNVFG